MEKKQKNKRAEVIFGTFTSGLLACRDLLIHCGVNTVAMESTSVYWTTIHSVLERSGIEYAESLGENESIIAQCCR